MLAYSEYYFPMMDAMLDKHGLPLELKYLSIVESGLNPKARSVSGAVGLWQFMYLTGKQYNLSVSSYMDERQDPFKSTESQVEAAVSALRPVIPLQFITVKLAFRVEGKDYGSVSRMLRDSIQKEEWLSDGSWVCVVTVPGGMKNDTIGKVASRSPNLEVKELD